MVCYARYLSQIVFSGPITTIVYAAVFGGRGGTGGIADTDCCACRGRCSFRRCRSCSRASRSACMLVMACSCCAMKSDVFGLG